MDQDCTPILEFSNVNKVFRGKGASEKRALKDLTLRLSAGMVVGLLGQNGAGKSTLMRCALGILSPDSGEIRTIDLRTNALVGQRTAGVSVSESACKITGLSGRIFTPFTNYGSV